MEKAPDRKPLILRGARQVGKTWLMKEFGKAHYQKCAYISMDENERMQEAFREVFDIGRIIEMLEIEVGFKFDPENTLIILDEVQEVPRALKSLKYFCEAAPQYHIIAAGSLLGIALHEGTSFPVGKVDFITNRDLKRVRSVQNRLLYGLVREGARAREYETAITWLMDTGLVYKINRVKKPDFPLRAYQDFSAFKLFVLEVKAEENLQAKSLKVFTQKYGVERAVRTSMSGFREQEWLVNFPLYNIGNLNRYLQERSSLQWGAL